jgi:hypothetical protein
MLERPSPARETDIVSHQIRGPRKICRIMQNKIDNQTKLVGAAVSRRSSFGQGALIYIQTPLDALPRISTPDPAMFFARS